MSAGIGVRVAHRPASSAAAPRGLPVTSSATAPFSARLSAGAGTACSWCLPSRREGALDDAAEIDSALHRVFVLDGAGVGHGDRSALRVGAEAELDVLAFDSAGQVRLAQVL